MKRHGRKDGGNKGDVTFASRHLIPIPQLVNERTRKKGKNPDDVVFLGGNREMAGEKILIIDDNPVNIELASDLLKLHGFQMLQAIDAETGIGIAKAEIPDLVLMDIQLPGMDGLEATRRLRADKATRNIPIVAITAFAMKGDEEKAIKAGCIGYIPKPINTRTFPETINNYLQKTRKGLRGTAE